MTAENCIDFRAAPVVGGEGKDEIWVQIRMAVAPVRAGGFVLSLTSPAVRPADAPRFLHGIAFGAHRAALTRLRAA